MTATQNPTIKKLLFKGIFLSEICSVAGSLLIVIIYILREFLFVEPLYRHLSIQYVIVLFLFSLILGMGAAVIGVVILCLILHKRHERDTINERLDVKTGIIIGFSAGILLSLFIYDNYSINLISVDLMVLYSIFTIVFATVSGWWISSRLVSNIRENIKIIQYKQ